MKNLILILCTVIGVTFLCFRDIPEVITASAELNKTEVTIVIDPGHGGEDGGTVGVNGIMEKDINLEISLLLSEVFEDAGYKVVMTRDGDFSIGDQSIATIAGRKASDIKRRVEICNNSGAELVLSVHQNYFEQSKYHGAQVFYGIADGSEMLAELIQTRLRNDIQPENTREIKPGGEGIYLLNNTDLASVIIECGFLSNNNEAELLTQNEYQRKLAYAIFLGTVEYLDH